MSNVPRSIGQVMWAPVLAFSCIVVMLVILLSLPFLITRMRRVPALNWILVKLSMLVGAPWPPIQESPPCPARKPLPAAIRNQLQVTHYTARAGASDSADADCCPICFCDYSEGQAIITLKCRHFFHKECIWKWLKRNATCPMCNADLQACYVGTSSTTSSNTAAVQVPLASTPSCTASTPSGMSTSTSATVDTAPGASVARTSVYNADFAAQHLQAQDQQNSSPAAAVRDAVTLVIR